jgi:hypothetical protein
MGQKMGTGQMKGNRGQVPSDLVRDTGLIPGLRSPWNKLGRRWGGQKMGTGQMKENRVRSRVT